MDRRHFLAFPALAACSSSRTLTVGAKNFLEQDILGEVLAQYLAKKLGLTPNKKLHLGGALIAHQALLDGSIDLYPEYSGTALTSILKLPLVKDPPTVMTLVRDAYSTRHNITYGWPLGFQNTFAMTIRATDAQSRQLTTLSDAVRESRPWRIGAGYEFESRPDGWRAFQKNYPLKLDGPLRTMDLGLLYRALEANEVDIVAGNSTDPSLALSSFQVLTDDQNFFPPYEAALAVRNEALSRFPSLAPALDQLSGKITVSLMRQWLTQATRDKLSPATIASNFVNSLDR